MTTQEQRSGDFLEDVEIIITIRSGKTKFSVLSKLQQALLASVTFTLDTELVLTELDQRVTQTSDKVLIVLRSCQEVK